MRERLITSPAHTPQTRPAASLLEEFFAPGVERRGIYRLSLLALVGNAQSEAFTGPVAELGRVPLALTLSDARRQSAAMKWES